MLKYNPHFSKSLKSSMKGKLVDC